MCSYCHQNNREKMGPSAILSVIHTVTIATMLNFNGGNNGHGLKNLTYKKTLRANRPLLVGNGTQFTVGKQ